jgi:hypothetical protein
VLAESDVGARICGAHLRRGQGFPTCAHRFDVSGKLTHIKDFGEGKTSNVRQIAAATKRRGGNQEAGVQGMLLCRKY